MKNEIRIKFVDFWHGFDIKDNFITQALRENFKIIFVDENPNYLFYSCFGDDHYNYVEYDCIKVYFTGENLVPNFNECDYALGFDYLDFDDRFLRYPLYATHEKYWDAYQRPQLGADDLGDKKHFCNFIYSNGEADPKRDAFFELLGEYKHVDAPGKHLRNTDRLDRTSQRRKSGPNNKLKFLETYKFTIAFENSTSLGYTTEKIFDAFVGRTIPIYWGNPRVVEEFNGASFIDASKFESFEAVVKEVERIDLDDDAFLEMLNAPVFLPSHNKQNSHESQLQLFLANIVNQDITVARRRPRYGRVRNLELKKAEAPTPPKKTFFRF